MPRRGRVAAKTKKPSKVSKFFSMKVNPKGASIGNLVENFKRGPATKTPAKKPAYRKKKR